MDKKIKISEKTYFLTPINSILKSHITKENFDYAISLISAIPGKTERLKTFNQFMEGVYVKVSQGEASEEVANIISKASVSEPLADFLKTFGKNWKEIKDIIPSKHINLVNDALIYTRNSIKFDALKDDEFTISNERRLELISSLQLDDQKEYFISPKNITKYNFNPNQIGKILCSFKHDSRKLKYIAENYANIVKNIGKKQIVRVVLSLNSDKAKMQFLKATNIKVFKFTDADCTSIINSLSSDKNKLDAIRKSLANGNMPLTAEQYCDIICHFNDDKNKLNMLNTMSYFYKMFPNSNSQEIRSIITKIICSLKDDESKLQLLTPENVEKLGLANFNIALITTTFSNTNNKKKIVEMVGKHGRHLLNLNTKNIARIVSSYDSDEEKIKYLNSIAKKKNHEGEQAKIISSLKNISYIKKYLNNSKLSAYKYAILLGMLSNQKSVSKADFDKICEMAGIDAKKLHSLSIPVLPNEMTIGVELETIGLNNAGNANTDLFREFRTVFGNFSAKRDVSLVGHKGHGGVEIISPILMNYNLENLNLVASLLKKNNLGVNDTCGAHVHIGADYLDSIEAWKNLCEIWGNNEDLMYQITNQRGTALRGGAKEYARPISPKIVAALKNGSIHLKSEQDLDKFVDEIKKLQYGEFSEFTHIVRDHPEINPHARDYHKYYGLNFKNINSVNKNTIEFRLPNGTINPQTLMNNIRLFSSIVAVSRELGNIEIAIRNNKPLTQKQARLLKAKMALVSPNAQKNPDERMSALMHLLFDKDIKAQNIYINRYLEFPKKSISGIKFGKFNYRPLPDIKNIKIKTKKNAKKHITTFDRFALRSIYQENSEKMPSIMKKTIESVKKEKEKQI